MKTKIFTNFWEFVAREDATQNGVSPAFAAANPGWKKENETNKGCWDAHNCQSCRGCYDCTNCYKCNNQQDADGLRNVN